MGEERQVPGVVSLPEWLGRNEGVIFRMWVLRPDAVLVEQHRMAVEGRRVPPEVHSPFVDDMCEYVYLREFVALPNGDFLVGTVDADGGDPSGYVSYYPLSQIRLAVSDSDQEAD